MEPPSDDEVEPLALSEPVEEPPDPLDEPSAPLDELSDPPAALDDPPEPEPEDA